ncbi:hypothetical protein CSW10_02150 [Mesomycoplasma dispar]|uniref:Uncharacterized protein n=1 Tax=Mesomycoplasma dispar TaxID=86660 RepID=A0ABM6PRA8_9BACT|nr:hypothetical protein CSW10_02150 [Mesomycoplasma dispar]
MANGLNQKGRRDLIEKIKDQEFKFMLECFDRNNLDNSLELIRSFREKMETNSSESSFFIWFDIKFEKINKRDLKKYYPN